MSSRQFETARDSVILHVTEKEGDGNPVLILHGLAGSSLEFSSTAAALRRHTVVTMDARGHGGSTRRPAAVSREAHVQDVIHVIETTANEPVSLVGHSMGGHTALLVASARPDLVKKLVLLEAGVGGDGDSMARDRMKQYFESWPVPFPNLESARSFLGDSALAHAWAADLDARNDGLWPRFDPDVMVETIAHVDARARWEEWASIQTPTLVVFAQNGMFTPESRDQLIARGQQTVRRVDIAGAGHDAHLDAFDAWIDSLSSFLDDQA